MRVMYGLDRKTHRYLIEPVSKMRHIKSEIFKRFIGFTNNLSVSCKKVVRNVYGIIRNDCRTTTGSNMRKIILECEQDSITRIEKKDVDNHPFHHVPTGEEWRIHLVTELLGIRDGVLMPIGWSSSDIRDTLEYLCTT